ncbi:hypothetical protein [Anaerotignum propionicum]|uniref:hypothetical protein n=1 Tax=Anaerotignum propionicum TaxID=28446 RepID=UPI002899697E|nr:hypothetical protein [Anaerotignum propionicum]
MKTYTDRTTAPLIFHDINRYVRLPISICIQAFNIFGLIYGFTWQWFDYFDLSFAVLFLILFIIAFIGCMKWKPSAWYALIALCALGITYNLLYLLLFGTILEAPDYAKPLVQIIGDICVTIYYLKRRPLFFSSAETTNLNTEESIQPISTEEKLINISENKVVKAKNIFSKKNIPLILCTIALIGSITSNVYQASLNKMLYQKISNLENNYEDLKGDYEDALEYRDYYKSQLYELKKNIWGYNFYRN